MKGLIHITIVSRALLLATAAVFTGAVPVPAWADDWSNTGAGDWFDGGNWVDGTTPMASDDANIDNGGTAQVGAAGATADGIFLGVTNGGSGFLEITSGGTVNNDTGVIGSGSGSTGAVTVTGAGATWSNTLDLVVGNSGSGTLTLADGARVAAGDDVTLGLNGGSSGTLSIGDGAGAGMLDTAVVTGGAGTASLNFNHTDADYFFTNDGTADGTAIDITGTTAINHIGAGTTTLTGANSYSGRTIVANGTLVVDGGDIGHIGADLRVGFASGDDGTLRIANAGSASSHEAQIGPGSVSTGTVTVTGAGSSWTNGDTLHVGFNGNGTLAVENGGSVDSAAVVIGRNANGSGAVTVTGADSSATVSGNLRVGGISDGELTVAHSGSVSSAAGFLGSGSDSTGIVTITGGGDWTNTGDLRVGASGEGFLTVEAGGSASNATAFVGSGADSLGIATVTGAGSTWTNSNLHVGFNSAGVLSIENNGMVSSDSGFIGDAAAGSGEVTVTGGGRWTNTGDLRVGHFGTGILNIGADDLSGTAGIVSAAALTSSGSGTVNFNQTDDISFAISIEGNITLNQRGTGLTTLTGANTYTGPTTVNAGTLRVNGSIANSATTVNAGATFGGTGTSGAVTVNAGAVLSPGASAGTLTTGDLTLNANSLLDFELDTPGVVGSGVNDLTVVDGNLVLDGIVEVTALGGFGPGTYTLIRYTGGLIADNGLAIGSLPAGFSAAIDTNTTTGEVTMTVMAPAPAVGLTPVALDFGSVQVDQTSAAQTVTLENTGTADLNLGTLAVSGTNASEFAPAADTCSGQSIAPAGTCIFSVDFTPEETGARNARIDIPSNTPDSPDMLSLTGTGVPAPAELVLMPGMWDFGDVQADGTAVSDPFVVENTGGSDLVVGMVTIEGPAAGDFQLEDDICSGQTVAPGGFCGFSVRFTPAAAGIRRAEVRVPGNAPESPVTAELIGTNGVVFFDGFEGN